MELHEFLEARIAEDEERARDAALTVGWDGFGDQRIRSGQHWVPSYHVVKRARDDGPADRREVAECAPLFGKGPANHIARWDPARVLAECESKRRIVEGFGSQCSDYGPPGSDLRVEREAWASENALEFHPHYPEEYAPFCDGCAAAESAHNDHAKSSDSSPCLTPTTPITARSGGPSARATRTQAEDDEGEQVSGTHTVKKFGMQSLVSPEMSEDRERLADIFEATLTELAEAKGFVVLPNSFQFDIREPNWITDEEAEGGYTTRDYMRASASIKCYDPAEDEA